MWTPNHNQEPVFSLLWKGKWTGLRTQKMVSSHCYFPYILNLWIALSTQKMQVFRTNPSTDLKLTLKLLFFTWVMTSLVMTNPPNYKEVGQPDIIVAICLTLPVWYDTVYVSDFPLLVISDTLQLPSSLSVCHSLTQVFFCWKIWERGILQYLVNITENI